MARPGNAAAPYANAGAFSVMPENFEKAMVLHAVKKIPKATWTNDSDAFYAPVVDTFYTLHFTLKGLDAFRAAGVVYRSHDCDEFLGGIYLNERKANFLLLRRVLASALASEIRPANLLEDLVGFPKQIALLDRSAPLAAVGPHLD